MENWKNVPNYEGSYSVSDLGNIKSKYTNLEKYTNPEFNWNYELNKQK